MMTFNGSHGQVEQVENRDSCTGQIFIMEIVQMGRKKTCANCGKEIKLGDKSTTYSNGAVICEECIYEQMMKTSYGNGGANYNQPGWGS